MNYYQTFQSKATCKKILTLFFVLFALCLTTHAQNVTISPSSGKLVAGLTYEGEIGFQHGWSSLWRHNQLPLTLTVSDKDLVTESGVLKDPAGDIILDATQNLYVLMSGSPVTTKFHMGISLPKGYRFTGYRIVLLNNMNGKNIGGLNIVGLSKTFYETDKDFNINNYKMKTPTMPAYNEEKEYVIERTSTTETDMGNNLYFLLDHTTRGFYGVTLKSCELYFTAEGAFDASVNPGKPTNIISEGVNMVGSAFLTSKLDLGEIKPHTKSGVTFYSYNFNNVKELTAQNWLYQEDAVTADKKLPKTAGAGSIQALKNGNNLYYALGNNTYYIETPTTTKSQEGTDIPLGYRITGAKIKYHYGTEAGSQYVNENGNGQSVSGDIKFGTSYLRRDATWGRSQGSWEFTTDGKLRIEEKKLFTSTYHYLYVNQVGTVYYVYSTTDKNKAMTFSISGNRIKYGNLFLVKTGTPNPQLTTSEANAATWNPSPNNNVLNPAFKPSPYTLKIYKTNKDNVTQMVSVNAGDDGEVALTNLNNDAIKFQVEGLAEGTKALITFELTLEALNPFINSIDIVCHSLAANGPTLMQQFTSNDFQVSGGKFIFYVPEDFFSGGEQKCRFTFENLYSKYGDNTYGNIDPHHARYFFVKSPYYNTYNGQQYSTTGNEPAADKIHSKMCGDKPFKYSNIDELAPGNISGGTTTLKEYPYSEALYLSQGGSFSSNIVLAVNQEKPCYLFTADETRWNIAPTTAWEHRYYAYYLMDLKLETKNYVAKCELTKLYDTTCYNNDGAEADLPMYGGVFKALNAQTGAEIPSESAYLTVPMMKRALIDELARVSATGKQVLYLDYTNLYSVHIPVKAEMDAMKALLNPNCLIFFPVRSSFNEDNYIQKKLSGAFLSCRNIVLTDRQPFYSPYKITVPAENYATYTRQITIPKNGKVANATLILPFSMDLQAGRHTNRDGLCSFSVSKMNASNCLTIAEQANGTSHNYIGNAYFSPVTESKTEANVPYMVKVETAPTDNAISFIATQYGAEVISTKNSNMASDYTFKGESATGTIAGTTYNFTNYGSYSGKKVNKDDQIFYFSGDMYLNSKNLRPNLQHVYVYPFRSYYKYSGSAGAKLMNAFNVLYGENELPTGIGEVTEKPDMAVIAGNGSLTFATTTDRQVQVFSTDGTTVNRLSMKAGETRTITLPAGIYIVNGKKIIVK